MGGHWDNNYTDRAQTFEPSGTEMMTPSGPASMVGASLAATTVATRENRSNINGKSENRKEQQYIYLLSSPFFLMLKSSCTHTTRCCSLVFTAASLCSPDGNGLIACRAVVGVYVCLCGGMVVLISLFLLFSCATLAIINYYQWSRRSPIVLLFSSKILQLLCTAVLCSNVAFVVLPDC